MIESRIPRARLILSALTAILLTGCGDATESRPGKSPTTLEHDLRQESRDLEKSRQALGANEQRIAILRDERTRDRRRLAELTASSVGLERRNRELEQQLARARGYLAETGSLQNTLRQQHDQNVRQVRALSNDRQALPGKLMRSRSATVSQQQSQDRFMPARWQPGPAIGISRHARLIPVATHTEEQPKSTRRERELDQARKKVEELELELEALTKKLQELEFEYATIKKQVQTLTWANEVLVKELEAAYEAREAGNSGSLPKGTRGLYVVQQGESLSQLAKAFYGDPGRWRDLVEANKDKISDPDMIEPGTIILIPD